MIFVSDVHYQIDYLNSLPQNKGPIVILGDLINWIDYRDGQGIAMDVFGKDNVEKLINLRKEHKFDERKTLWKELYKTCLLYTSPSPRDKRQSRMPSSA